MIDVEDIVNHPELILEISDETEGWVKLDKKRFLLKGPRKDESLCGTLVFFNFQPNEDCEKTKTLAREFVFLKDTYLENWRCYKEEL